MLYRNTCAVGNTSAGTSIQRFTQATVERSLTGISHLPEYLCGFRPNTRLGRKASVTVPLVTSVIGCTVSRRGLGAAILLRAVTKGKARINHAFRRLTRVVSRMREGSHINIYLSAYRICSNNCSVIGSLSNILGQFSRVIKLRGLGTIRLGSSGGPLNDRGSERRGVKRKAVNARTFTQVVGRPTVERLPFFLRAPGRLPKCGGRVTLLHSLERRRWSR